jgi:hypothetical protein
MTAWLPSNMVSIQAWFDPTQGMTTVSGGVSNWASVVGSYAGTQATANRRPAFSSTSMNGFPGVTGSSANSGAYLDAGVGGLTNPYPRTFVAVGNAPAAASSNSFFSGNGGDLQCRELATSGGTLSLVSSTNAIIATSSAAASNDVNGIYVFQVDSGNYGFRFNGTAFGSGTHSQGITSTRMYFFLNAGNTEPYLGTVGDYIFASAFSTLSEVQKAEGYLAWKYNLVSSLPSGHPYKSAAPTIGSADPGFVFPRSRHYVRR